MTETDDRWMEGRGRSVTPGGGFAERRTGGRIRFSGILVRSLALSRWLFGVCVALSAIQRRNGHYDAELVQEIVAIARDIRHLERFSKEEVR